MQGNQAQSSSSENVRRVLIADDVLMLRAMITIMLETEDELTVVGEASNGDETLEKARALRPDIILLDINMPGRSGLEILPDLRRCAPEASIIIFSGLEAMALAPRAIELGADDYIEKGASGVEIVARLRKLAV
jgi:DNA-binding NarL/FixJ family response regulator